MGALTKKEREALDDVFLSIHSETKFSHLQEIFSDMTSKVVKHAKLRIFKFKKHRFFHTIRNIRKTKK